MKPRRFKHHQNSTRKPPEREGKNEISGGRVQKKREILGPPPFGPPTLRAPLFLGLGPHPSGPPLLRAPTPPGPHPSGPPPLRAPTPPGPHPSGPPLLRAPTKNKIGQIRFGQIRPNKDGQNRFGQMRSRPVIFSLTREGVVHTSTQWAVDWAEATK